MAAYIHLLDTFEAAAELKGVVRGVVCIDEGKGDGGGARSDTRLPEAVWQQGVVPRECRYSTMLW